MNRRLSGGTQVGSHPDGSRQRVRLPRVLAFPYMRNAAENAYQAEIYGPLVKDFSFVEYSPVISLLERIDVFQYHWPETYLNQPRWLVAAIGSALFGVRLILTRLTGGRSVWAVHNAHPHERLHPRLESIFYHLLVRTTDTFIFLSESSRESFLARWPFVRRSSTEVIPHPFYRVSAASVERRTNIRQDTYLLTFGQIRPYKNVPAAIRAVLGCHQLPHGVRYRVVGRAKHPELAEEIRALARDSARIDFEDRFVEGSELARLVAESLGVVLPYSAVSNSGAAYYALSVGVPVLCPAVGVFDELERRYPEYIHTYIGEISPGCIAEFIQRCLGFSSRGRPPVDVPSENARIADEHRRVLRGA
jgi:beta-1,4-mannosyltransferase